MVMNAIIVEIAAYARTVRNHNIFVENGTSNATIPTDRAVVQDDRVFDGTLTPNDHIATQHGAAHHTP